MGFSSISGHHSIFGSDSFVLPVAVFVYYNNLLVMRDYE